MFDISTKVTDFMSVVLTHECNRHCPFCIDSYRGSGEFLSLALIPKIISEGRAHNIKDILLIGGEPTLHPHIVEIARLLSGAGFRLIMTTNYQSPEVVSQLDGIVDCINISNYGQFIPDVRGLKSDYTLHTMLYRGCSIEGQDELDTFITTIETYHPGLHLKFSTLQPSNKWSKAHQKVEWLDSLPNSEWPIFFNEVIGQVYRGYPITRHDKPLVVSFGEQSLKFHVDGEVVRSWTRNRSGPPIGSVL